MGKYEYQDKVVSRAINFLNTSTKPLVLAMTTSSGKSATVTKLLNKILSFQDKAIFLGSNLTTIANQYYDALESADPIQPNFNFSKLCQPENTQLKVGLPQGLIKNPIQAQYLILDEAQWLWGCHENPSSLISKAIQACGAPQIILLTGSPAIFNKNSDMYNIVHLSYENIPNDEMRVFSKVDLDVLKIRDRTNLYSILDQFFANIKKNGDHLGKFAVVARNISEAESIFQLLESRYGIRATISTSKHDKGSEHLVTFKNGEYQAVVTVSRIIAGWSYTELTAILDLRSSLNITNTFQLLSRLFRVSKSNPDAKKTFICIAEVQKYNSTVLFLHKVISLLQNEIYRGFNNKNLQVKVGS